MKLQQLVNIIDLMEKEELSLPLVQVSGSDKGVNLLTAMALKDWNLNMFFLRVAMHLSGKRNVNLVAAIVYRIQCSPRQPKSSDDEELRRLFYVALTRAEKHLFISFSRFKNDGKDLEPSMFIAEILDRHLLPVRKSFYQ